MSKKRIKPKGVFEPLPRGTMHLPKNIRDELGYKIGYVPNAHAVILFNPEQDAEKILQSLEILKLDLENRIVESKK